LSTKPISAVFLQEEGESNGLIVIKDADNKGFTVKKNGGTSNITFSFRIMAKRLHFGTDLATIRFGAEATPENTTNTPRLHLSITMKTSGFRNNKNAITNPHLCQKVSSTTSNCGNRPKKWRWPNQKINRHYRKFQKARF
jgi:hypothetical protein